MPKRGDTFPHYRINVDDQSRRDLPPPAPPGLHRPIFFGFAEKGPVNVPMEGSYAYLSKIFGQGTFSTRSKYFQHPNLFARKACQFQEIFFVRLADATAAVSTLVLEASVETVDMVQYEKDDLGARTVDENGDYVPLLEIDGVTPVTEPGIQITWNTRVLGAEETITNLQPVTVGGVTTYPVLAFTSESVGSAGNLLGYKLYYTEEYEQSVVDNIDAMTYRFAPVLLDESTNIALPIRDIFSAPYIDVALKPDALDPSTTMLYDMAERVRNQYVSNNGAVPVNLLPAEFHVYEENVELIGNAVLGVSTELAGTNPYRINIMSAVDEEQHKYDHLEIVNTADYVHANRINYLQGGSDGDLSVESLENLTSAYMTGDVYPEIADSAQYPITHVYDSGYNIETKKDLIDFLGVRDDIKIDLSTQDVSLEANLKAEDQSTGSTLRAYALLYPESTFYGTQAMRVAIYQQAGMISEDPLYKKWVPATMDRMIKRCMFESTQSSKGQPTGLPNSAVTIFKKISWTPIGDDHKRLSWGTALNYFQFYDQNAQHYPDLRTVYPYDNSLLSDDIFVDRLVYIKHICRRTWAAFVGRREPSSTLYESIEKTIDSEIYAAFGSEIQSTTTVFQTAEDEALGFQHSVNVRILGPMPMRVLDISIPVDRMEG